MTCKQIHVQMPCSQDDHLNFCGFSPLPRIGIYGPIGVMRRRMISICRLYSTLFFLCLHLPPGLCDNASLPPFPLPPPWNSSLSARVLQCCIPMMPPSSHLLLQDRSASILETATALHHQHLMCGVWCRIRIDFQKPGGLNIWVKRSRKSRPASHTVLLVDCCPSRQAWMVFISVVVSPDE